MLLLQASTRLRVHARAQFLSLRHFSGYHSGAAKDSSLLVRDAGSFCKYFPTFRSTALSSSSGSSDPRMGHLTTETNAVRSFETSTARTT